MSGVGEDMELRTNITWLTTGEELHHHHNLMASVRDQCHKQYSEGYLVLYRMEIVLYLPHDQVNIHCGKLKPT